jgi:hypothetical protein
MSVSDEFPAESGGPRSLPPLPPKPVDLDGEGADYLHEGGDKACLERHNVFDVRVRGDLELTIGPSDDGPLGKTTVQSLHDISRVMTQLRHMAEPNHAGSEGQGSSTAEPEP